MGQCFHEGLEKTTGRVSGLRDLLLAAVLLALLPVFGTLLSLSEPLNDPPRPVLVPADGVPGLSVCPDVVWIVT